MADAQTLQPLRVPRFITCAALFLALALLCAPQPCSGAARVKYGAPLKFDKPPVDTSAAQMATAAGQGEAASAPADQAGQDEAPAAAEAEPPVGSGAEAAGGQAGSAPAKEGAAKAQAAPVAKAPIRLFGTVEFRSPIKNLPKWERVLKSERGAPSFTASGLETNNKKVAQRWLTTKERLTGAPLMEQVREVNKFFNVWPYKTDQEVWKVEDYWATPKEFVQKSGDCEDYAISKYYALRDLGVPAGTLRIVAVKDTIRNLGHAVLVVYAQNEAYILDNLSNMVLSHKKLSHYAPQFSVNEEFLWRHVKPKAAPGK